MIGDKVSSKNSVLPLKIKQNVHASEAIHYLTSNYDFTRLCKLLKYVYGEEDKDIARSRDAREPEQAGRFTISYAQSNGD